MGEAQRRYSAAIWAVACKTDFCTRCGGEGVGWLNGKPSPCPSCGNLDADKREDEMIFDRHRNSPPVALSTSDLTQEERGLIKLWRAKYGRRYGDDILLSWIEGRRYDPRTGAVLDGPDDPCCEHSNDPETCSECRADFEREEAAFEAERRTEPVPSEPPDDLPY